MAGGKTTYNTGPRLNGVSIQSSAYGAPIGRGWGTFRAAATVLWYGDFQAIPTTTTTRSGGKGGGGGAKSVNTTYAYKAALALAICAGPIEKVSGVWRDKTVFTGDGSLGQAGLSLKSGAIGQAAWGHLTTAHPDEAIGYSGLAYAYSAAYDLNDNATIGNHSFEVVMPGRAAGGPDANPADILSDFLSEVPFWSPSWTGDLTDYESFCLASGLLLSPYMDGQIEGRGFVEEILRASNADCVFSDGKLKIVPLGDVAVTGNGETWEPDLTPIFDLTDDDFLPASEGEDPVQVDIKRPADAYNKIEVEFRDRSRQYNEDVMPGVDQANIDEFGLRKGDVVKLHCIKDRGVAAKVADILVGKSCNVRKTYRFRLPDNFSLLEPLDLVTLTTGSLDRVLVRIKRFDEDDDEFDVEAEEVLVGTAAPAELTRQETGGYQPNYEANPGPSNAPVFVNPPRALTGGEHEVWIGTAGGPLWGGCEVWVSRDGDTYEKFGTITAPTRYGSTTSVLREVAFAPPEPPEEGEEEPYVPVTAPPTVGYLDPGSSVGVNLTASEGTVFPATESELDALATLCVVGDELVAYRDATLTGANRYALAYMRRGLFGTGLETNDDGDVLAVKPKPSGSAFVRLDGALLQLPYRADQIGDVVHIKLRSFNIYGRGFENLEDLTVYPLTLNPNAALYIPVSWDDIGDIPRGPGDLTDDGDIRGRNVRLGTGETVEAFLRRLAAIADELDELGDDAADTVREIFQIVPSIDDILEGVLRLSRESTDLRRRVEELLHVEALPVGTVILNERVERQEGQTQIVEVIDLIGVVTPDGEGFAFRTDSVRFGEELLIDRFSGINFRFAEVEGGLIDEQTARIAEDEIALADREALAARAGEIEVAALEETTARIAEDEFQLERIDQLSGRMGEAEGDIIDIAQLYATLNGIVAARFSYLGVDRGDNVGFILSETRVEIGVRGTVGSILNALSAADGANSAAILSEASIRASETGAQATLISGLRTDVNGNITSITQIFEITDDLALRAALVLNSGGRITGYEIDGIAGSFIVAAEYFAVASAAGGTPRLPFEIAGSKIRMGADVEVDGSIVISDTLEARHIKADNITIIDAVSTGTMVTGDGSVHEILSYNLTLPIAAKAVIVIVTGRNSYVSSSPRAWYCNAKVNGGQVSGAAGQGFGTDSFSHSGLTALAAGSHTISVDWYGLNSEIRMADATVIIAAVFR